jgi:ethanolamine ammonia-lyase small subunit
MKYLRDFTMARVGIGKAGDALPTQVLLELRQARAAAADAVHEALDVAGLVLECQRRGWPSIPVRSAAHDRAEYLRRPDLGRTLHQDSRGLIHAGPFDLSIMVADGLSALAVHRHAFAVLDILIPKLRDASWTLAPLTLVEQGRVAIGDDIGALLEARLALILIGERPGLTSPDSLGAYLTWSPARGKTDAERNCVSNIRPEGLPYDQAAARLFALLTESRRFELSGIALKAGHVCTFQVPEKDGFLRIEPNFR